MLVVMIRVGDTYDIREIAIVVMNITLGRKIKDGA